jgi:hypothetical protein
VAVVVPCPPAGFARWTQRTSLAGRDYVLEFDWIERAGKWALSIADHDDVSIRAGMVLATNFPLLRGVIDSRRPPGELVIVDTTGANDVDVGFVGLDGRFLLVYFDRSEVVAGRMLP